MPMPPLQKGLKTPLNVTQEAKHRIFVGLGWDPKVKTGIGDKIGALIGRKEAHHDLDLSCFYFDHNKHCLGVVSAIDKTLYSDPSGTIYHSGDNVEGVGDGDDEQISAELKILPDEIESLIFKASIKSGHTFDEVAAPEIRLCDGYTERCFINAPLDDGEADAFIFIRVYRDGGAWAVEHIGDFAKNVDIGAWKVKLQHYL